eukprot:1361928-Pleurochrysis_carterae.AAC.1
MGCGAGLSVRGTVGVAKSYCGMPVSSCGGGGAPAELEEALLAPGVSWWLRSPVLELLLEMP